ncbi:MAG: ferrochelatase [Firmicutes bacterium]|nr:ferrochelatase [Bacillota bacterium]
MTDTERQWGILLLSFGGPARLEEIPAFLRNLMKREPPAQVEAEVTERYRQLGGGSPLPETTRRQGALLQQALSRRGHRWPTGVGMAYAQPSIEEAVLEMADRGVTDLVLLSLAPYRSTVSTDEYEAAALAAIAAQASQMRGHLAGDWFAHPRYIEALCERIQASFADLPPQGRDDVPILFTAHSLPLRMIEAGDPYVHQIETTIRAIDARIGPLNWRLAFQSRSLAANEPWLSPSAESVIEEVRAQGHTALLVDPIGFVSDHLETLHDNDIEQREKAHQLGLDFHRVACLNDSPRFIEALVEIVEGVVERVENSDG